MRGHLGACGVALIVACSAPEATTDADLHMDAGSDVGTDVGTSVGDTGPCAMPDRDGDHHRAMACGGDDCDDDDMNRFPGNSEVCDVSAHDEDCDPHTVGFRDGDSDTYSDAACCNVDAAGARVCGPDCDDLRPNVHPTAAETCDAIDDDCDLAIDEGLLGNYFHDGDGDGFGDATMPCVATCVVGAGCVGDATDCNDAETSIHPGATEVCDAIDQDCNSATPEPQVTCYRDADSDGFRDAATTMMACTCPAGWLPVAAPVDCCDGDPAAHPGGASHSTPRLGCGGFDYDCDGVTTLDSYPSARTAGVNGMFGTHALVCPGSDFCGGCYSGQVWDCNSPGATCPPLPLTVASCGMTYSLLMCGSCYMGTCRQSINSGTPTTIRCH
jgi:hypothetical protein